MKTPTQIFRTLLALVILASCIGCDQATKRLATQALRQTSAQSYLADTIRLEYVLNSGGFLGLGGELPPSLRTWIFIGFNACLLLSLAVLLLSRPDLPLALFVAIVCILAGGSGNLIDRIANDGFVTDFIHLGVGPFRTGIFNVADVAILFGAVAMVFLFGRPNPPERGTRGEKKT